MKIFIKYRKEKKNDVNIFRKGSANNYDGDGSITQYNFDLDKKKSFEDVEKVPDSDIATVVHEMQHQYDYEIGNAFDGKYSDKQTARDPSEQRAVQTENRARKIERIPKRTTYGGEKINPFPNNYILPSEKIREEKEKSGIPNDNKIY